jgi:uncharacterized protein YnzC (UPF0291/DUF896 family)
MSGATPALCHHGQLTPEQVEAVRQAENRQNYSMCSSGQYPALCRHDQLTPEQAEAVRQAELRQNYSMCSSGQYPALCHHDQLTPEQAEAVRQAELRQNYSKCISGQFPVLCHHDQLTTQQAAEVRQAEHRVNRQYCSTPAFQFNCHRDWLAEDNASAQNPAEAPAQTAWQSPQDKNYATCMKGTLSSLCDHSLLTPQQAAAVRQVEHQINRTACETPSLQWSCHRDWLAEDAQNAARQAATQVPLQSVQTTPPRPAYAAGAPSPSSVANLAPTIAAPDTPVNTPAKPRCEAFWLGAVETNGDYAFLSDYRRLAPAADSDKAILRVWQRGQRLVRCGSRLTNKETGQSIDVSG